MLSTLTQMNGYEHESKLISDFKGYDVEDSKDMNEGVCDSNLESIQNLNLEYKKDSIILERSFNCSNDFAKVVKNVGFANLPNQLHRKAVRRGFVFNLMITGSPGLGKSTFINALFCSDLYNTEYLVW